MYKISILIHFKKGISNPSNELFEKKIKNFYNLNLDTLKIGKSIEFFVNQEISLKDLEKLVDKTCSEVFANPVLEDYEVEIKEVSSNKE